MPVAQSLAEQLPFLIGAFAGVEKVHATPWAPGGPAEAHVEGRCEVGGEVLVQRQTQLRDGVVAFTALNVFMCDAATGQILLYGFDSLGFPADPPARGRWSGDELVLDRATARGESRTTYLPTVDGFRWSKQFRSSAAEGWSPMVEGHLTRQAG